ncbi:STN domain-containing protein [Bradyrhizobium sp. dw_78]|uniref:STN domain-containing protein n=1 Tax=Bradyrhizobium sp. dw_78 TaxID=2719793 RepID=UPI001BD6B284|nr:STN domain-containing protein [Bradyrhizobium sp. dw_78]
MSGIAGDRRRVAVALYVALLIVGICAAKAVEGPAFRTSGPVVFDIPAQPLASALQAFGEKTGVQVLYESSSALGRQSAAVEGSLMPEDALNLLLAGTELRVRYVRPDAITIALPSVNVDLPPSMPLGSVDLSLGTLRAHGSGGGDNLARLHDYSEAVQMDVQKALRGNAITRRGDYRAVLDLWVDPTRSIQKAELFQTTGDLERDSAVISVLRSLTISRPTPPNTPQPVRVVIVVKPVQ